MDIKEDIQMLWNNQKLIKATRIPLIFALLLFFINVSLISVPNYFGVLNGIKSIDRLEGINESFQSIYDNQIPCEIDLNFTLLCTEDVEGYHGQYRVVFQDEIDTTGITESTIFLGSKEVFIVYIDHTNQAFDLAGDYRLLGGFNFTEIKNNTHDFDTREAYYDSVTDIFLSNLYFSNVGERVFLIFVTQFSQITIYLVLISIMLMILNYRSKIQIITYKGSIKITILAMTGPALLSAILGVFFTAWGALFFTITYALRMMFVYYKINKTEETIR